jgi:hypothetical protein
MRVRMIDCIVVNFSLVMLHYHYAVIKLKVQCLLLRKKAPVLTAFRLYDTRRMAKQLKLGRGTLFSVQTS